MNLILADDHELVNDALCELIRRSDPEGTVYPAVNFDQAAAILAKRPEVEIVLLDLYMPGMLGISGAISLLRDYPDKKIVLMSGAAAPAEVAGAIEAGIHGFVPKSMPGASLVALLPLLATGVRYFPPELLQKTPRRAEILTEREQQVIIQLRLGATNKMIAQRLGMDEMFVKSALRSAGNKLGARTRTEIALKAMKLEEARPDD